MKILIIKLGAIGDAVMASALLPELRERYPESKITWLCGKEILPLVKLLKGTDEIFAVDNSLLTKGLAGKIRFVLSVWRHIAGRRFDLCITGHSDRRWKILSRAAFCRRRVSFDGGRSGPIPGRYHGTEYARLATGEDENIKESYPLASAEISPSATGQGMVLLLPGGAKNLLNDNALRRWPVEHYRRLAELLIQEGLPVGLIGSEDDRWTEPFFDGLEVVNFMGKTDIPGLLSIMAGAGVVVSHDSGPMHMAYLAGAPLVALMGPVNPSERIPPGASNIEVPRVDLPCVPCYDGRGFAAGCRDNICLSMITPETVLESVKKLI